MENGDDDFDASSPTNLPGLAYLRRWGTAYVGALERQAAESANTWNALKSGNFDLGHVGRAWASLIENHYELLIELSRGPSFTPSSPWVYFRHTVPRNGDKKKPSPLQTSVQLEVTQPLDTQLRASEFASLQGGKRLSARGEDSLYESCHLLRDLKTIKITLDVKEIDKQLKHGHITAGDYLSFIYTGNANGQAPLAIVLLAIVDE